MSGINAESTTMPPVELRMPRASERVFANFNFTVLDCCPVTIGEGCVIGAGSVVTRDIPPHTVAVGNPARPIREITDADASALQLRAVAAAAPRLWLLLGEEIAVSAGPIFAGGGGGETCGLGISH